LRLFDDNGRYVPTWEGIGVSEKDRVAYRYVNSLLKERGLSDGTAPPVWTFECVPDDLDLLATMLLSDHELETFDYVTLELRVPDSQMLRTSYGDWCELYFSILETGAIEDDGRWIERAKTADGEAFTVQAILPFLRKDWIVSAAPLTVRPDLNESGHRSGAG